MDSNSVLTISYSVQDSPLIASQTKSTHMLHYYVYIELIAHTIHEYQTTLPKIFFAYEKVKIIFWQYPTYLL